MGTSVAHSQSDNRRLQFSLATLLIFVTGICVTFSLVRWHSTYGLMAAILTVASGWSFASMRAGYHRLAYTLATPAMGVAGHLALIVPMAVMLGKDTWNLWLQPAAILLMSASTILAATLLRSRILAPGPDVSIRTAVGVTYVTAAFFPLVWGVVVMAMQSGVGMFIGIVGLILSPVCATLTLPLTLPLAVFCCLLLRKLDPWRPGTGGPITLDLYETMRPRENGVSAEEHGGP
jgi:hypothetical protein